MREVEHNPAYGTRRVVEGYMWKKTEIIAHNENGTTTKITRWLEDAKWEESYTRGLYGDFWKKIRWLDLEEE